MSLKWTIATTIALVLATGSEALFFIYPHAPRPRIYNGRGRFSHPVVNPLIDMVRQQVSSGSNSFHRRTHERPSHAPSHGGSHQSFSVFEPLNPNGEILAVVPHNRMKSAANRDGHFMSPAEPAAAVAAPLPHEKTEHHSGHHHHGINNIIHGSNQKGHFDHRIMVTPMILGNGYTSKRRYIKPRRVSPVMVSTMSINNLKSYNPPTFKKPIDDFAGMAPNAPHRASDRRRIQHFFKNHRPSTIPSTTAPTTTTTATPRTTTTTTTTTTSTTTPTATTTGSIPEPYLELLPIVPKRSFKKTASKTFLEEWLMEDLPEPIEEVYFTPATTTKTPMTSPALAFVKPNITDLQVAVGDDLPTPLDLR